MDLNLFKDCYSSTKLNKLEVIDFITKRLRLAAFKVKRHLEC